MKCLIDTHDTNKGSFPEQELTEEQFFEQFAALEDGLALLQIHMRGMSETPNSSAASQGTCGDQFAPRLYLRGKARDRCQHAYNNATNEGSFLDIIATFRWRLHQEPYINCETVNVRYAKRARSRPQSSGLSETRTVLWDGRGGLVLTRPNHHVLLWTLANA